jgi:hypothetical protein
MFEATLFDFSTSQMRELLITLLTPTIAFTFFYLNRLPLNSVPFIGEIKGYNAPRWVLPVFCLGSLLAISTLTSSIYFLTIATPTEVTPVVDRFGLKRELRVVEPLTTMAVELREYDGFSNLQISVNGYVVLDSEQHCALDYQCKSHKIGSSLNPTKLLAESDKKKAFQIHDARRPASLHYVSERNPLPFKQSILPFIVDGRNYIDIAIANAGTAACQATVGLLVGTMSGTQGYEIGISPKDEPVPDLSGGLNKNEMIGAGGTSDVSNRPPQISPYGTFRRNHIFRVCHRIRIEVTIDKIALDDAKWEEAVRRRAKEEFCKIFLNAPATCSGDTEGGS